MVGTYYPASQASNSNPSSFLLVTNPPVTIPVLSATHEQSSITTTADVAPRGKKRSLEQSTHVPSKQRKALDPLASSLPVTTRNTYFKVPAIPASRNVISKPPAVSPIYSGSVSRSVDSNVRTRPLNQSPQSALSGNKNVNRFVPLVIKKATSSSVSVRNAPPAADPGDVVQPSLQYLDFPAFQQWSLEPISLPPSLSQRKEVPRLALILSGISVDQVRECAQVSRLFRYAGMTND
jgi:hypothetical protein